ncbi:MAG: hypothetical protein JEZ04_07595 [Spirochaetales bacterium]|nr:hypothetical protein [Spirochaetales bacterium]
MEVEPVIPENAPPRESSLPADLPIHEEDAVESEVVQDDELGENVDLMA